MANYQTLYSIQQNIISTKPPHYQTWAASNAAIQNKKEKIVLQHRNWAVFASLSPLFVNAVAHRRRIELEDKAKVIAKNIYG